MVEVLFPDTMSGRDVMLDWLRCTIHGTMILARFTADALKPVEITLLIETVEVNASTSTPLTSMLDEALAF